MRIVYLLESAGLWGGVVSILEAANRLHDRGHQVTVVSRGESPSWTELRCEFRRVESFTPESVPDADVVIGEAPVAGMSFTGHLDEVRISRVSRTTQWIRAQYESMNGAIYLLGPEEPF